jgi:hypothetical protein
MCSTEITREGDLPEQEMSWAIERGGCGATTAYNYRVLLGRYRWWRYPIFNAYAMPEPAFVEDAGPDAVRVTFHSREAHAPGDGYVIPVTWLGRAEKPLWFHRGHPE